jgi:hypothetical protein
MHVRMHVCMYVCMHACMYVSMYACMHATSLVSVCTCLCPRVCVCVILVCTIFSLHLKTKHKDLLCSEQQLVFKFHSCMYMLLFVCNYLFLPLQDEAPGLALRLYSNVYVNDFVCMQLPFLAT